MDPSRAPQAGFVRCWSCHGEGAYEAPHPLADWAAWPQPACFFTPGCAGRVGLEGLN